MFFPVPGPFSMIAGAMRRRAAFTLMELMVTMGVGLIMIVFLFQLFNATARAWRNGEDQSDTYREARAAMQMMVRDIGQTAAPFPRNAYPSPTPTPVPTPTPTPTPTPSSAVPALVLDHYPGASPAPADGNTINEELYCLTNVPNNGTSSLCAVGYFCVWMPDVADSNAPHAYALVRQFLGSGRPVSSSYPNGVPGLFDRFQAVSKTPPSNQPLDFINLYERAAPLTIPSATLIPPVATCTQLASYIWDLQFRTPDNLTFATKDTLGVSTSYPKSPANGGYPDKLPPYIEIRFKALSARAARQLEGNKSVLATTWQDPSASGPLDPLYQRIILPGTRQFVARVPLGNSSAIPSP